MDEILKAVHMSPVIQYDTVKEALNAANVLKRHIKALVMESAANGKKLKINMIIGVTETKPDIGRYRTVTHYDVGSYKEYIPIIGKEDTAHTPPHIHIGIESNHAPMLEKHIINYYIRMRRTVRTYIDDDDFAVIEKNIRKQSQYIRTFKNFDKYFDI